jgi:acetyltransferase
VVSIRPIEASDADGLATFYATLSDDSRRKRFLCSSRGLTVGQARSFASVDHRTAEGFVAVTHGSAIPDGPIVGHVCLVPNGDGTEEVAIAVADAVQGQGIGTRLMRAAVASAVERGVRGLTASLLYDNGAMRRLLASAGLPMVARGYDGAVATFLLPISPHNSWSACTADDVAPAGAVRPPTRGGPDLGARAAAAESGATNIHDPSEEVYRAHRAGG